VISGLKVATDLMAISARTAPKAAGKHFVVSKVIEGHDLNAVAKKMVEFGQRTGKPNFDHDAANVWDSEALLLVGIKDAKSPGFNCGACGAEKCVQLNTHERGFEGPQCAYRLLDMGVALWVTGKNFYFSRRVMFHETALGRALGLVE